VIPAAASSSTITSAMIAGVAEPWLTCAALATVGCALRTAGGPEDAAAAAPDGRALAGVVRLAAGLAPWAGLLVSCLRAGFRTVPAGLVFSARTLLGLNVGTPDPLVSPLFVPPNSHRSTLPGAGRSFSAPTEL
jgi:predicted metal-binding membrane protein